MRTVTYGAACSLDGYIAGHGEALDWMHFSPDVQEVMTDYWSSIDTILMGRKTWEFAARQQPADAPGGAEPAVRTYVFSRSLESIDRPGVELVKGDAGAFVRALKAAPGKGICLMGGGALAASLLEAGVVDDVGLNLHPVMLGGGVPMFPAMQMRTGLDLVEARQMDGGCMLLNYRVKR